jgi:D-alanyl-D-alanine carboxypeptidase
MTCLIAILFRTFAAIALVSVAAAPALAQVAATVDATTPDGRLYGHIPYQEADPATLVDAPRGFALGHECEVEAAVIPDLTRLIDAAHAAHLGAELRGISCFRSVAYQTRVFCDARGRRTTCVDPEARALSSAPPGHSEHATGYALDFGARPDRGCADVENCFADTPVGKWLILNAPDYGFELSFPKDNAQGVTWEPWHWRWVGTSNSEPGALTARALFDRARTDFPADPRIPTIIVRVIAQPPLPTPDLDLPDLDGEAPTPGAPPQD